MMMNTDHFVETASFIEREFCIWNLYDLSIWISMEFRIKEAEIFHL